MMHEVRDTLENLYMATDESFLSPLLPKRTVRQLLAEREKQHHRTEDHFSGNHQQRACLRQRDLSSRWAGLCPAYSIAKQIKGGLHHETS